MILPVYILIRTSGRPLFFARMMETIKTQDYKNIVTIVHTDDPRDRYVAGDVIIKGTAYSHEFGSGPYNLYNNRLLEAIPKGPGWYHFIDDDDEYAAPDVISRLVAASKPTHVNVARVQRVMNRGKVIFPDKWGVQKSYQTECFFLHTDHKAKAKWWANKGGDHYYSKQLTRIMPINWIENLLICKAQESKGHGNKFDKGGKRPDYKNTLGPDDPIACLSLTRIESKTRAYKMNQNEIKYLPYAVAYELEKKGKIKITYPGQIKKAIRNIYEF